MILVSVEVLVSDIHIPKLVNYTYISYTFGKLQLWGEKNIDIIICLR